MNKLVLAGTYRQAIQYADNMNWQPKDWKYIHNQLNICGCKNIELYKIGTWYLRNDITEILQIIEHLKYISKLIIFEENEK